MGKIGYMDKMGETCKASKTHQMDTTGTTGEINHTIKTCNVGRKGVK